MTSGGAGPNPHHAATSGCSTTSTRRRRTTRSAARAFGKCARSAACDIRPPLTPRRSSGGSRRSLRRHGGSSPRSARAPRFGHARRRARRRGLEARARESRLARLTPGRGRTPASEIRVGDLRTVNELDSAGSAAARLFGTVPAPHVAPSPAALSRPPQQPRLSLGGDRNRPQRLLPRPR